MRLAPWCRLSFCRITNDYTTEMQYVPRHPGDRLQESDYTFPISYIGSPTCELAQRVGEAQGAECAAAQIALLCEEEH